MTLEILDYKKKLVLRFKLVSAIFYQLFIFSPSEFINSQDIQIFLIFPLPFHTF